MPRGAKVAPYRFLFFSNEGDEPPHVHVERERRTAKFWLRPVALASDSGFGARELIKVERVVGANRKRFLEAWHGYFGRRGGR